RELPRLSELRLRAQELCIGLDLRLGRRAGTIAELRLLTRAHPLRERLHGLLMLALCQDERRAEALAAYQDARTVLNAELGTEPGPELRQLHQRILTADPALSAPPASVCPVSPPVPHQLPPTLPRFAGRCGELAALRWMTSSGEPAIVVVTGAPGVGKTATTLRLAHDLASQFPDGQLYADLRGYGPGGPVPARDVLAGFLRSLGVTGVPLNEAERAAMFRSLITGRRILIALDDADCASQVRPLLPAASGCTVLITSRDPLAALVIEHGARRLDLDRLSLTDAVELLQLLIGDRVDEDPAAARELALQCARLPLALCLAAELAATRPAAPLATLARELAERQGRLELLDACTDLRFTLRAAFAASYQRLDLESARVFRMIGLLPGADAEPYAIAVMTGSTVAAARQALTVLARAHLIQPVGPVRYRMHGLLQAYATELALAMGDRLPAPQKCYPDATGTLPPRVSLARPERACRACHGKEGRWNTT
ncbi:MAG TPA: AfsR/SARP family transcriptional regulator, partial [Streptosporangiaceae bacterium]|nr:AfsR/SARP family transcriptional regulator [Streptosporangiaceae bacterium]